MRVSMEYFMKRRNLSWSSFAGMEYKRYEIWCQVRKIIPVSQSEYEASVIKPQVKEILVIETEPVVLVEEIQEHRSISFDLKELNKKNKITLVELADVYGITLDGSETKKQIVQLLVNLNN